MGANRPAVKKADGENLLTTPTSEAAERLPANVKDHVKKHSENLKNGMGAKFGAEELVQNKAAKEALKAPAPEAPKVEAKNKGPRPGG